VGGEGDHRVSWRRRDDGSFQQSIVTDFVSRCIAECRRDARRAPPHDVLIPLSRWHSFGQPFVAKAHLKLRVP
jgi:hypothetical protein